VNTARRRVGRPLAKKFFIFTATLVFWVIAVMLAYDMRVETFDTSGAVLLFVMVVLVSGAIAQFTSRALARPLSLLREGITAVQSGELTPIEVSRTRDEVEFLGESFNQMIRALAESQLEIREASQAQHQFLANLSEELGGPMQEIVEILDQTLEGGGVVSDEALQQLQKARCQGQSLLALLSQVQPTRSYGKAAVAVGSRGD